MNVSPEVWEDASNRNLLSFSQEFIKQTTEFGFNNREKEHIYLVSFLTNLTELSLCDNNISDISSISKLKNLNNLNLSINIIEDISALQSLTDLNHLNLQVNKLTSYTLALPNLVELLLDSNKLKDISGVQHSPKLERLYLSLAESADLRTIPCQLFGLKELYLSKNNLTEISHLSNFLDLQILSLHDNNQLQHIVPLKFCAQLTELTISATSISDIWPLQFLKNLKTLYMAQTQIDDLHPLQHLYKLQNISAPYSGIIDVSPLSKLTQLNFLSFSFNKITKAETLKHHQNFFKYSLVRLKSSDNRRAQVLQQNTLSSQISQENKKYNVLQKYLTVQSLVSFKEELRFHDVEQPDYDDQQGSGLVSAIHLKLEYVFGLIKNIADKQPITLIVSVFFIFLTHILT
ncbi:Conserved_hypothetical protein [Hexamita inflata]|uniref:Chaoptin n=1 Tax=Hexamita inflata TaxID=28002 RepID=A0AA86P931_9EUKA|nr:Conserved hypothetical protein [Hexamita inflata]CAI9974291.1 Conserved hypothetical protein [Hexamita inflata]